MTTRDRQTDGRPMLKERAVLVFRDQNLTPQQHIAFSHCWGPLHVNVRSDIIKSNIPPSENDALLQLPLDTIQIPDNIYRHGWRVGDLLMWDNGAVQHKVSFDFALPLRRRTQQISILAAAS